MSTLNMIKIKVKNKGNKIILTNIESTTCIFMEHKRYLYFVKLHYVTVKLLNFFLNLLWTG